MPFLACVVSIVKHAALSTTDVLETMMLLVLHFVHVLNGFLTTRLDGARHCLAEVRSFIYLRTPDFDLYIL
jgi:hypothetical protein